MHRYIAFVWNTQIAEENVLAKGLSRRVKVQLPDWTCAFHSEGLLVYHTGATPRACNAYRLTHNGGVVLGKLFTRETAVDSSPCDVTFSERETERIHQGNGRRLVEHYWGRYVAMLKPELATEVRILRDPTGAMPCFITKFQSINVICSHVDDCATLGLITFSINWDHIVAYLWFDHMVATHTGLEGVRQVQAGECIVISSKGTISTYYWSPHIIHSRRLLDDRQQAMRELRNVVQYCVEAWASCYSGILHGLSGGLDSSVVLACLSRARNSPNIVCENHFTPSVEGDERVFARQAAKAAKVELIEMPLRLSDRSLESMFEATRVATPTLIAFIPETQGYRERFVKAHGIGAVFSGQGGDHLFQNIKTRQIAAEYAWHHGMRRDLLAVIVDTSRFTRKSIWSVMVTVFKAGLLRRSEDPYETVKPSPLFSDPARCAMNASLIRHPWVDAAIHLPSSKRRQIFSIVDTQNFFRVPNHYADIVHPLISQPIIEVCLQIPSYVLTYGGIDRALVRQAFNGLVPSEVLLRTTKGATTGYFHKLLGQNLSFLRGFLLDGLLMTEGVLDRRTTQAVLSQPAFTRGQHQILPILDAIRAEIWLRTWTSTYQRAAA